MTAITAVASSALLGVSAGNRAKRNLKINVAMQSGLAYIGDMKMNGRYGVSLDKNYSDRVRSWLRQEAAYKKSESQAAREKAAAAKYWSTRDIFA